MGKLGKIVIAILLILVTAIAVIWAQLPHIISSELSKTAEVEVDIQSVHFSWNQVGVRDLFIGNPPSYNALPKAFSCETINVNAPIGNYMKEELEIEEIHLEDLYLGLEFDSSSGTSGNWTKIFENINKNSASSKPSEKDKVVKIKKVTMDSVQTVVYFRDKNKRIELPTIEHMEFKNINTEKGAPMQQIMQSVLGQMLVSVFARENLGNMLNNLFNPGKAVETILSPITGIFGGGGESSAPTEE